LTAYSCSILRLNSAQHKVFRLKILCPQAATGLRYVRRRGEGLRTGVLQKFL
jgi:hypothetical protein